MNFIKQLAAWLNKNFTLLRGRYTHWQKVRAEREKVQAEEDIKYIADNWQTIPPWLQKRIQVDIEKAEAEAKKGKKTL